ncbi:SiaB family protein kinase [Marinitoga arctica]
MNPQIILDIKKYISNNNIIMTFIGPFSQGIIEEIGHALREYVKKDKNINASSNNVFSVFIEQSQNIKNYERILSEKEKNNLDSILIIGKSNYYYTISSGNVIRKDDKDFLKSYIDYLNSLDKDEIKKLYKKKLRESINSKTGGAGLGFLEMAKRASEKFEYDFIKLDNYYYYFILIIKVK